MLVEECVGYNNTNQHQKKNDMPANIIEKLVKEKQQGREVKYLRMGNIRENKLLEQYINKVGNGLDITVEYVARNRP